MMLHFSRVQIVFTYGCALLLSLSAGVWAQEAARGSAAAATASAPQKVVLLWPDVAPGSAGRNGEESVREQGSDQIVSGVHRPSLTVYLPSKAAATGAAVIVAPGGSYRELWISHEGYRVAEWLSQHGIAGFVLKYRLPREQGSTYTVEGTALSDMQRAIRTVRAHAAEWGIDPQRVGVMGFSAGAHLAGLVATRHGSSLNPASDEIDRQSAKPAFQALIYPPTMNVVYSADTPQAFLACGGDDQVSAHISSLYQSLKAAGVPTELHIYAGVGHGFGIRANNSPRVAGWVDRFRDWMSDRGLLTKK
jgi:endo-1,4-beta-xylanase